MCRRSAFSSSLLDQHNSPDAAAWFIGCPAECRPVCNAIRTLNAVRTKKDCVRGTPPTVHTARSNTWFDWYSLPGLASMVALCELPNSVDTLSFTSLSMLLSEYESAVSQCVGTCQHQHAQPICHGVLCMVQGVPPSVCMCVVSPSSPKVSTQSLSSHCADHISPSATRIFRTTLCTRCVSLGVSPPRKLWRRLGSAAGAAFALSSLSRHRHFLRAALIVALSWMGIKIGSPIDATMLSASSA